MKIKNKLRFKVFLLICIFITIFIVQLFINIRFTEEIRLTEHIIIDPGHGGKDPGTIGINGVPEKDIALRISLKLADQLEKKGYKVTLLRSEDFYIENIERARISNNINASIYLSIHCNAVEKNSEVNGIQTLYYPSHKNEKIANILNTELLKVTNANDKGIVQREDLIVLNQTKMPSFIIETGFLSNNKEAELLMSENYQEKIVSGIINGIERLSFLN